MTSSESPPAVAPRRSRRRARIATGLALASVAIAAVAFVLARPERGDGHVGEAIAIASPADGYDTGLEAGRTLARTASALNRAIGTCDRAEEPERCAALGAASGYTQVVAAAVVRCTAPGRAEARQSVLSVLGELRTRAPRDPPPRIPPVPRCGG